MTTKKPVTDTDVEPEYDFRDSVPNPYADRYWIGRTDGVVPLAAAARVRGTTLIVSLADGRELRVPIARFPRLAAGSVAARANIRITEGGRALHWPDLDEDIGVEPLMTAAGPLRSIEAR
jgi:hypothetical protein